MAFNTFYDSIFISSFENIIARSHTVLSQMNMVVIERYELNFWWKSHEESMQCDPVHYY